MKKISIALGLLCLMSLSGWSQTGRPRSASPTPTPTPLNRMPDTNPQPQPNTVRRPPVLNGNVNPAPTPPVGATSGETVEEDEVIRVETNLVTMPVSVLDRDGRFISGLRQEDFRIFEDNAEQKIEYFASVEQPFTVVLLIDVSPSTQYQINEIQDAAIAFVNQLRRDDRVIVMSFNEQVRVLSQATNNRAVLRDAILRVSFGDGTSLYDAVDQALNQQLRNIQGRKAVVLFSDGVDTTSQRASYTGTVKQAEEIDALIYTIRYDTFTDMGGGGGGGGGSYPPRQSGGGWGRILGTILGGGTIGGGYPGSGYPGGGRGGGGGAGSSRAAYEAGRRYMEELSRNSGGRSFLAQTTNNLETAFGGIAEELRRQYSIGYYPESPGQTGQRKQIRVRVERPGAVVRAKNTYIVGEGGANTAKQQQPSPQTRPTIRNRTRLPF